MRALAFAAFLVFALPAFAQDITGPARVIDGDTIDVVAPTREVQKWPPHI